MENTARYVAFMTKISIRVVDSSGRPVASAEAGSRTIYVVMPGQRAGIGGSLYVHSAGVVELTAELDNPEWWPLKNEVHDFGDVAVRNVEAERDQAMLTIEFEVESDRTRTIEDPVAYAVFRNSAGEIVGGAGPSEISPIHPGVSEYEMEIKRGIPHGIDEASIQVYVSEFCC